MSSITDIVKKELDTDVEFREKLYFGGFLITDSDMNINLSEYPFYNNWRQLPLTNEYHLYLHKDNSIYTYEDNGTVFFLIGHAYDPFSMLYEEKSILQGLASAHKKSEENYWREESNLTGVFLIGFIRDGQITYSTDCCGMQYVCHGVLNNSLFLSSHSKLLGDLCNLEQDALMKRLISNRMWRFYGRWLPGDLSPYKEFKRLQPNIKGEYNKVTKEIHQERYYPTSAIIEVTSEEEYANRIAELGDIMSRSMKLISEKWNGKDVSISVTGGRDSMTTLACTNGLYDRYHYFSYISNEPESIDAYASDTICNNLGLKHEIYEIPQESEDYRKIDLFAKILECNSGCVGKNNANDVRKRLYFIKNPKFDLEVKSWLNEMGRGWYYRKYRRTSFPKHPTAAMLRSMYKPFISPYILHHMTKIFREWMEKYFGENVLDKISWLDLYYWEFTWSGNEGLCLTSEHKVSYEITIPFNNRRYFELMLTLPLEKRAADQMPIDLIGRMNKAIIDSGIVVHDVNLSDLRTVLVRTYFNIFSKLNF